MFSFFSAGDGSVGKIISDLRRSLNEVIQKLGDIAHNIKEAARSTLDSKDDIDTAEKAIENADSALRMAENYVDKEGRTALKQALDALANFGQNSKQMTEIAVNATNESKR